MWPRARVVLGVLLLTLVDARGASAHTRSAVWNGVMQVATSEWGRDRADIDLLLEATTELMAASPTFNQLVDALKSSPHLTLFVRPTTSREHLGRGRFYLSEGWSELTLMSFLMSRGSLNPHKEAAMAGGTFGGDGSVKWVIDVDNARPNTVKSNPKGNKGHAQEGIDETDPGDFTIRIRVPKTATAQAALVTALQAAAEDTARGIIKVSFKLPIESETYDQIQVEWNSKSAQGV